MTVATIGLWILAVALILVGLAGTLVPALPGPILVFAGMVVGAWAEDFTAVGPRTLALLGALTAVAYAMDFLAGAIGTRWAKAGRRAFWGASIGAVVGLFFGLPGLVLGPFLGAVAGELTAVSDLRKAGKAGLGAWLGLAVGTAAKFALVFAMVAIFAFAHL